MIRDLLLLALIGCAPAGAVESTVPNPHGQPDQCAACHVAGPTPTQAGPAKPIVATCRSCHPTADMHPVGMAPKVVHVHDGWPLEDGKVVCSTCHAEPAHGGEFAALSPPWHRGGPYPQITGLCYSCHEATDYTRKDPHHPQAARDPNDSTCSACHTAEPAPGATVDEANLRFPTADACRVCHEGEVHAGVVQHVGERVDPAGWEQPLPLAAGNKIACWTCHEVHGGATEQMTRPAAADAFHQLVLRRDWTHLTGPELLWPGSSEEGHPPMLALTVDDGALCRSCHGEGG